MVKDLKLLCNINFCLYFGYKKVWEMIIAHVESSKDLINLSTAIPTCKQLLDSKKNQWLFDQVRK